MPFENYPVSLIGANKEPLKNFVMGVIHSKRRYYLVVKWVSNLDSKGKINEIVVFRYYRAKVLKWNC
jgi:hypothetical protein